MDFILHETPRDTIIKLLKYEQSLRLSDEMQDLYDTMHEQGIWGSSSIEQYIQRKTLQDFGYNPSVENMRRYQRIVDTYYNDTEVMNSVMYLKYFKLYNPIDLEGRDAIDTPVYNLDGTQCSLKSMCNDFNECLILAGSIS